MKQFISVSLLEGDNFIPVPKKAMVDSFIVSAQAAAGVAGAVTLLSGALPVMVVDAAAAAAGAVLSGVRNATNGREVFSPTNPIKITCVTTNDVAFIATIQLNTYLTVPRPVSG